MTIHQIRTKGFLLPFRGSRTDRQNRLTLLMQVHWPLVLTCLSLVAVGLMVLYTAAGGVDPWVGPQVRRVALSIVVAIIVMLTPSGWIVRCAPWLYVLSMLLLLAVLFGGTQLGGAQRWIRLSGLHLQPSELARLSLGLVGAWWFARLPPQLAVHWTSVIVMLLLIVLPVGLVFSQPDLGATIVLMAQGMLMLFVAGVRWRVLMSLALFVALAVPVCWIWLLRDYQRDRLFTFFDVGTGADLFTTGYQIAQSHIALGSGGTFGRGFLEGTQSNLNFLPEKHTDFIFVVFAEQFGFIGSLAFIGLFVLLGLMILQVCLGCRSYFYRLLGFGVLGVIMLPTLVNLAMVSSLLPVVGMPLPFISYGGSAMITNFMAMGLALNAWRCRRLSDDRLF